MGSVSPQSLATYYHITPKQGKATGYPLWVTVLIFLVQNDCGTT